MTENRVSETQTSPHAAQLEKGFPRLRFEPALEREFMENYWTNHRLRVRSGMIVGTIIFFAFSIKDIMLLPKSTWIWTVATVDGFIVPVMLFGASLTWQEQWKPWITRASHVVLMLIWIGFVASLLESRALGTPIRYESIMLTIAYILFSTGLRTIPAVTSCIFGVVLYIVGSLLFGTDHAIVQTEAFHLIAITVIGTIGAYARETMLRKLFLTQSIANFRAEHDPLTQLLNRGAAMRRLETAWNHAARQRNPISIILVDADHFKSYNDRYGHLEGDKCLQGIGRALKEVLCRPMDMVGRFGGEEFVALAYDTDREGAVCMAEKIRVAVEHTRVLLETGHTTHITVSIGVISLVPSPGEDASVITNALRQADSALYAAKSAGRNCFVLR